MADTLSRSVPALVPGPSQDWSGQGCLHEWVEQAEINWAYYFKFHKILFHWWRRSLSKRLKRIKHHCVTRPIALFVNYFGLKPFDWIQVFWKKSVTDYHVHCTNLVSDACQVIRKDCVKVITESYRPNDKLFSAFMWMRLKKTASKNHANNF